VVADLPPVPEIRQKVLAQLQRVGL